MTDPANSIPAAPNPKGSEPITGKPAENLSNPPIDLAPTPQSSVTRPKLWSDLAVPLPGEPTPKPASVTSEIPLAKRNIAKMPTPKPKVAPPVLANKPLWPVPEEIEGRRWLAAMVMLAVIGLYSWFLSTYYAGAHGGVDQAGYLMTARLLAGDKNVDDPAAPARETPPASATGSGVKATPTIWPGGDSGFTEDHPAPAPIQTNPRWDWLRNRLSFVPESPFDFASRMCVMTEPYGPANPGTPGSPALPPNAYRAGAPAVAAKPAVPPKPAEYRIFAKYPFGFSLMAATGKTVDAWFDHKTVLVKTPSESAPAAIAGPESSTQPTTHPTAATKYMKQEAVGRGLDGMYIINPLCTVLACFFAYFLFRQAVSPFVAIIGVIWLACNPLVLSYANDANSHASTLFCVCIGFWGLVSFLRTQQIWRAWIGGFALGYACTIRYSEFLLILPVVFAAAVHFRLNWRRALGSASLIAAWAIPVATLALVCYVSFGSPTKTGYTYCNEDTGFGWGYLSGDWGDRVVQGNWETLVTQLNQTGLFIMWPLALAGIFGMLGSAWRLGGVIVLWIVPSLMLYMLYYWAPNNANNTAATGYLRFYVSIMPGMIFAGIWMLERALGAFKGEKWAGLITGTLLGLALLIVVALYADGGPTTFDGGIGKMVIGLIEQTPPALWHLLKDSREGMLCAGVIIAAVAGMWIFDRSIVASRLGVALGAGVITALGCAVNLRTIMPTVESSYARWTTLRTVVDNLRETLPRGTAVFCDDNMLQQLDCVGGWKLYDTAYFTPALYAESKRRVDMRNTPERMDEPDPLQAERSRFYMELLSQTSTVSSISLGARTQGDLLQLQHMVIDENIAEGHRVTFLRLKDSGDMVGGGGFGGGPGGGAGRISVPKLNEGSGVYGIDPQTGRDIFDDYQLKIVREFTVAPMPTGQTIGNGSPFFGGGGRGGRGGRGGGRGGPGGGPGGFGGPGGGRGGRGGGGFAGPPPLLNPQPQNAPAPQGATYTLYELIKKPTAIKAEATPSAANTRIAAN